MTVKFVFDVHRWRFTAIKTFFYIIFHENIHDPLKFGRNDFINFQCPPSANRFGFTIFILSLAAIFFSEISNTQSVLTHNMYTYNVYYESMKQYRKTY